MLRVEHGEDLPHTLAAVVCDYDGRDQTRWRSHASMNERMLRAESIEADPTQSASRVSRTTRPSARLLCERKHVAPPQASDRGTITQCRFLSLHITFSYKALQIALRYLVAGALEACHQDEWRRGGGDKRRVEAMFRPLPELTRSSRRRPQDRSQTRRPVSQSSSNISQVT